MIFILLLIGLSSFSLSGMQLPVAPSSERRPMEESFFILHAQADRRLNAIEGSVDSLENILATFQVDTAAQAGIEKVKRACNDAVLQDLVLRTDAKAAAFAREQQENNAQIREQKAQQESRLAALVRDHQENNHVLKTDLEALKTELREQNRQQEQARVQLQAHMQQLNTRNAQLATELEAQKNATKKVYLVGSAVCLVAAGTALYLGARIAQHDQELYGCQESQVKNKSALGRLYAAFKGTQAEVKGLSEQVASLQNRPYVSKDHNNALVYNAPNGSGPVRGAHVSKW